MKYVIVQIREKKLAIETCRRALLCWPEYKFEVEEESDGWFSIVTPKEIDDNNRNYMMGYLEGIQDTLDT